MNNSPIPSSLSAPSASLRLCVGIFLALSLLLPLSSLAQYSFAGETLVSTPDTSGDLPDPEPSRPWYAFWRSSAPSDDTPADADAPAADVPSEPVWLLSLADGTKHFVRLSSIDFKLDSLPAAVPFSPDAFSAVHVTTSPDDPDALVLLAVLREHPDFALRVPAPRSLRVRASDGAKISVPWADVLSLRDPDSPARAPAARAAVSVAVTYADPASAPAEPPVVFPVAFLPLKTAELSVTLPSWCIRSVAVRPDRSCTVRTVYGDVLSGTLPLKRFAGFEGASEILFASPHAKRTPPPSANRYRLASGDILVASPDLSAAVPAAPTSLRAAVAASAAAPDAPSVLLPAFDPANPVSLPPDAIEAVAALDSPLPPAIRPWTPSAQATDEVLVPAATFQMGCAAPNAPANESPSVRVALDPYYLSATPVTVAQYAAFIADTGYARDPEARSWDAPGFPQSPNDPVVAVSWRDAVAYCNWLSKKARLTPAYAIPSDPAKPVRLDVAADGYRLPLESEWELAAKNLGNPVSFPWGDDVSETNALAHANFFPLAAPRPFPFTSPVKTFPPNPLGLYDLAGNVAEWCQDAYAPDAYSAFYPIRNFAPLLNPDAPTYRVIRGGSFASPLTALRVTGRAYGLEIVGVPNGDPPLPRFGFRTARNAP